MPLLYYWRGDNYRRDLDLGAGYHLNQGNPRLHDIGIGDSLWAFTRSETGRYALAAELVVRAKTFTPGASATAATVSGETCRSRYFRVEGQANVEPVIRGLSIRPKGDPLGRSFQGHSAVRRITPDDHQILADLARDLPLEPRARLLPEESLEALLLLGDPESVERLLLAEPSGIAEKRPGISTRPYRGAIRRWSVSCGTSTRAVVRSASGRPATSTGPTSAMGTTSPG